MALPIPRTLAEPTAPARPCAGLRRAITARNPPPQDSAKGVVPLQEVICNPSLTQLTGVYACTIEHVPGAHEVDVHRWVRRSGRARSPQTSSPVGKTISDKAES